MIYKMWQFHDIDPISQQLAHKIQYSILCGELHAGENLPSAREMAKMLNINPSTVLKSYKILKQERFITSSKGGKYTVTQDDGYIQHKKQETIKVLCCSYLSRMFGLGYNKSEAVQYMQEYSKELKCHDQ